MIRSSQWALTIILLAMVWFGVVSPQPVYAATETSGLVVKCNQPGVGADGRPSIQAGTECTVADFFEQFVIIAQFGYSLIAILSVLMFVYGGYQFLIAGGRSDKVELGRKVITGTVMGLIISLGAYVIINFTVAAITGRSTNSLNPLKGIALVFPGQPGLQQPFSGTVTRQGSSCRTQFDHSGCFNQVYCADSGTSLGGKISTYQDKLNQLGCQCGTIDGCFGGATVGCVRRFQIANDLPASGMIDGVTANALDSSAKNSCTGKADFVNAIASQLPAPATDYSSVARASKTDTGCCVVEQGAGNTPQPLYCLDHITERACAGLGNHVFVAGPENCIIASATTSLCGFCEDTRDHLCFDNSGSFWCSNIINPPQSFHADQQCNAGTASCGSCLTGLRSSVPFTTRP